MITQVTGHMLRDGAARARERFRPRHGEVIQSGRGNIKQICSRDMVIYRYCIAMLNSGAFADMQFVQVVLKIPILLPHPVCSIHRRCAMPYGWMRLAV